jgi:hypothetical protein
MSICLWECQGKHVEREAYKIKSFRKYVLSIVNTFIKIKFKTMTVYGNTKEGTLKEMQIGLEA